MIWFHENVYLTLFKVFVLRNVCIRSINTSSCPDVFGKNVALKYFAEFTGKYLHRTLFFSNFTDLSLTTLLKKRLQHLCFPMNFVIKDTFFTGTPPVTASAFKLFCKN